MKGVPFLLLGGHRTEQNIVLYLRFLSSPQSKNHSKTQLSNSNKTHIKWIGYEEKQLVEEALLQLI
jgi:hypothetical protein